MIEIIVNGKRKNIPAALNVKEVIKALNYTGEGFALALNGTFVALSTYESTIIKDNDSIEILAPVQGG
ncbi:sulfur carrier protein ThiS [Sulfurovum sp.]|uniref:sulfur carrier protein ThiS n=1 Tax=Sulfurovum sp. TaxID=1969726 RepID=UPI002867C6AB|nr:sulfur carrier protein ThiS [Sulfurovum sp.]